MEPLVGAALVQGGTQLVNAATSNARNKRMAKYTNQLNIENWSRQNEYNLPSAQMQRYKDAGLNPNLIYGSGSTSAGNAGSVASAPSPQMKGMELSGAGALAMVNQLAEIAKTQADTANIEVKTKADKFDLAVKEDTREEIINAIKADTSIKNSQRAISFTDAVIKYRLAGGEGDYTSGGKLKISDNSLFRSPEWVRIANAIQKEASSANLEETRAQTAQVELELTRVLRDMGANNETIRVLTALIMKIKL